MELELVEEPGGNTHALRPVALRLQVRRTSLCKRDEKSAYALEQRRERVVEDEVELERFDNVELALEDVFVLERVHRFVFIDTS